MESRDLPKVYWTGKVFITVPLSCFVKGQSLNNVHGSLSM